MKKTRATLAAVMLLSLTACGGAQEEATPAPSPTVSESPETVAATPLSITDDVLNKTTGEVAATVSLTSMREVQCGGENMRAVTLNISAPESSTIAPNYFAQSWKAYKGGKAVESAGVTSAALGCTPSEYHSVMVNPGETVRGIEVVFDIEGADAVGLQLAGPVQEMTVGL